MTAVTPEPDVRSRGRGRGGPGLQSLLERRAALDGSAVFAYLPDGTASTYTAAHDQAVDVAERLSTGRLTRVGVRIPNRPSGVVAVHGCWRAGCAAVLLSPTLPEREVDRRLEETRCQAFYDVERDHLDVRERRRPSSETDDEAVVIFTSGTSGRPKGAVLGFRSLAGSLTSIASAVGMEEGRRPRVPPRTPSPTFMPLAHVGGFLSTLTAMYLGKPTLIVDRWDVDQVFDLVDRFELTMLRLAPAMVHDLAHVPGDRTLGPVRTISVGSASLSESVRRTVEERYGVVLLDNYGQTELAGAIAFERYEDIAAGRRPPGSVGRVAPGVEIRIVDADGHDVVPGATGEIWARGPGSLAGYVVDGGRVDPTRDGWVATRDLGRLDPEGFLYLAGRIDDVVNCGGFNVYPAVVEAAIGAIPGVLDAAVVGLPDDRLGEVPVAALVSRDGGSVGPLLTLLQGELAPHEIPRRVTVVPRIPRNEAGKVDRAELRSLLDREEGR